MKDATASKLRRGMQLARTCCNMEHLKSTLSKAARFPAVNARHAIRNSRYAVEDFADTFVLKVRKQPVKSIGVTFGLAFGIGALAGWLRNHR